MVDLDVNVCSLREQIVGDAIERRNVTRLHVGNVRDMVIQPPGRELQVWRGHVRGAQVKEVVDTSSCLRTWSGYRVSVADDICVRQCTAAVIRRDCEPSVSPRVDVVRIEGRVGELVSDTDATRIHVVVRGVLRLLA